MEVVWGDVVLGFEKCEQSPFVEFRSCQRLLQLKVLPQV